MTLQQQLLQAAFGPLIDLTLAVATVALGFLANWAHHKANGAKQSVALQAIVTLSQAAENVVQQLEATVRPAIPSLTPDGSLTQVQAANLKATAIQAVEQQAKTILAGVLEPAGLTGADLTAAIEPMVDASAARVASNTRNAAGQAAVLSQVSKLHAAAAAAQAPKAPPV